LQKQQTLVSLHKHSVDKYSKLQTGPACNPLAVAGVLKTTAREDTTIHSLIHLKGLPVFGKAKALFKSEEAEFNPNVLGMLLLIVELQNKDNSFK
jgi:hypothetical protein